jgi:acyl carrier protein
MATFDTVRDVVLESRQDLAAKFKPEAAVVGDLGLNSLEIANLTVKVERAFGIEIPMKAMHTLVTVADVVKYIESHRAK